MKKGLLGSTALVAATALSVGAASAAEAPTVKFSGFMNFQAYFIDTDRTVTNVLTYTFGGTPIATATYKAQDNAVQLGTDDAEFHINVSGTTDSGLNYGFKIEMEATQGSTGNADEARIQLGGSWGTLQLGDEDGAEDIMNVGGESLLGATGGWDGDGDDATSLASIIFPTIAGDTSDATKITYYSPDLSGFKIGVSYTPDLSQQGDQNPFDDGVFQDSIAAGVSYSGSFGGADIQGSFVYDRASYKPTTGLTLVPGLEVEDISAWSVGGIVGFGPVKVGANYTDNGDSGQFNVLNADHTYWNVAAGFESGPFYVSAGYISHTYTILGVDLEPSAISVTADYTVAEGFGVYAEYTAYDSDTLNSDANVIIVGTQVSF